MMKRSAATRQPDTPPISLDEAWTMLEATGWLAERPAAIRDRLRGIAELRYFDTGEFLYHSGDTANGVYALVSGGLNVSIPRPDNEEFIVHRAEVGWWAGELGVFSGQPRLISMSAAEPSQLVFLKRSRLLHLVDSHPEILREFYKLTNREMATALHLLGNLVVTRTENRVALRLAMLADALPANSGWINVSQASLADFTALSQQTLRRVLGKLERRGLVERGYNRIRVLDRAGLAHYCGSDPDDSA